MYPAKRQYTTVRNTEKRIGHPNVPWNLYYPSTPWAKLIQLFAVYVDTSAEYPNPAARVDISPNRYHGKNTASIPKVDIESVRK